jgi:TetR/AcrR family transcriptional regulator, transcriptional repressor of bet genes
MPKIVDHEARRAELGQAVWRLASRDGLDAVTVRAVAAEAGWSTGALVHYFKDKEELLRFAFRTVADRVGRRLSAASREGGSPRELLRFALEQGLPLDDERRAETRVWFAFLGLALTRPALARAQRAGYRAWRDHVAATVRDAQEAGEVDPRLDAAVEAAELVALVDGLAVQAMFEPRAFGARRLRALLEERLARLQVASGA